MKKHIYVFRHGQTDFNKEGRVQGQSQDPSLNENGLAQAAALAEKLQDTNIEIVFSSPLKRAQETAKILAERKNIPLITEPELIEINLGKIEGVVVSEIDPKQMEIWCSWQDIDFCFEGGESKRIAKSRMISVMKKLVKTPYNTIAVSTHATMASCLLHHCGHEKSFNLPQGLPFHFCYENGKFELISDLDF